MDWTLAIERNRRALAKVLTGLVGMVGWELRAARAGALIGSARTASAAGDAAGSVALPRGLYRMVLRLLRPTESAVRRLVIVAARAIVVPPPRPVPARPGRPGVILRRGDAGTGIVLPPGMRLAGAPPRPAPGVIRLSLFDPPRRPPRPWRPAPAGLPRISVPGFAAPSVLPRRPSGPGDSVDATRLVRRLDALGDALDDLDACALRFARWRARCAAALRRDAAAPGEAANAGPSLPWRPRRVWPMRAGRPPGFRRRGREEIHAILADLNGLARDALQPDTS